MASENNSDNPIGNATDTAQQDWLELDQQGVGGETLKAKKWTTKRRLVDDSSSHGNIHTGTEQVVEFDKGRPLTGEASSYQSLQTAATQGSEEIQQQEVILDEGRLRTAEERAADDTLPPSSSEQDRVTEGASVVARGGGADPLVFDERFDEPGTEQNQRNRAEAQTAGQSPEAVTPPQPLTETAPAAPTVSEDSNEASAGQTPPVLSPQNSSPDTPPEEIEEEAAPVDTSASAPVLNAEDASGLEDTTIELDLSSHLTDNDGSESLRITISGVPEGAILSAGNNLGGGIWELGPDQLAGLGLTPPTDNSDDFSLTVTSTSTEQNSGQQSSVSEIIDIFVEAVNDAPVIDSSEQITRTEESMEGFTGYGETWEGDVYSIVTQAEMLDHLGISDVDSDSFTVSLANASPAWHEGLQSNDSTFSSDTLAAGSSQYDETVVQITQEFLDNYPTIDAQVGDFYFDHVDFDALSEGEIANVSFSVQVSDGEATSAPQDMNIQISGSNDAPTISATVTLPDGSEDNAVTFTSSELLANATDVDAQDTLFVTNLSVDPEQGSISTNPDGSFTFSPVENFNGEVSISYDVTDGVEIVPTSASLTLNAVNDNPIAVDDGTTNTQAQLDGNDSSLVADSSVIEDNSTPYTVSIDVTPDSQDYGYIISNGGQTGAASGFFVTRGVYGKDSSIYQIGVADENQSIIFQGGTVEDGQQSNLTFTYDGDSLTVYQDGVDITDTGTISTRAGRDLPMQNLTLGAPSNILSRYEFKGETDNIQVYDSALEASEVAQIQDGVVPDPGGLLAHYTFEGDTGLEDQSGFGHTLQANGNVEFTESFDPNLSTSEDAPLTITAETLLANDSDVDGDSLSITAVSENVVDSDGNIVGSATQDADGNIVFTPAESLNSMSEGESTTASFSYTVSDGQGGTDSATATINIAGANDAISVVTDSDASENILQENAANGTEVHLTGLASDADGDAVSYSLVDEQGNAMDTGAFTIDQNSGVVTLQDRSQIDYETADSHTLHIQASSADGTTSTSDFTVQIGDVEVIKTTDLGGDDNGTAVTFTLTGDHYDPKNIQDVGAGSPQYRIRVNGELLEVDGQNTFSVEANRGHVEDNQVVRDGNDVELVTFRVPAGTDVDSVAIEFTNDAWDSTNDNDGDGITTEDRNLVVKELNIGGTLTDDGTIDGGVTLQAEDTDVSQYIASNGVDVSGREVMPWRGTMTFYPDGVNEAPVAMDDTALDIQFDIPEGGSIVSTDSNSSVVTGKIVAEGDTGSSIDQWTFHHNGGPVTIDTLSESGSNFTDIDGDGAKDHIDTMMRLYDSDGNQVAMNDDSSQGTTDGSTNDTYAHIQDSFIQLDDLPPGNYSLAIGSWELTSEEVAADHNENYDTNYTYDHVQDTGPYQITITGDHSFTQPDPLTTDEDSSLTITANTLLANDSDADGDSLSITAVSEDVVDTDGNVVGTATQDADGNIVFTPGETLDGLAEGDKQAVSFSYTVSDGQGGTDTATATINVIGTDNDLTYVSETAGYKNVVGLYQTDDAGNPIAGTVVIDDQNGMAGGTHLADLEPGNHEFFIIANGANEVDMDSAITFDTSGDKPVLLIDGQAAAHPVYFTEPSFNPDGKDHFQFRADGEGGTYVNIEDLPNLGDADFGDVVLHTNFEMSDRTLTGTAVDGIIEGLEYNTTSGIHGFTDSSGDFSYNSGDSVTFNVGGVTLGVATPEDLSTGTTFLQDIADVERTNLNDEYLENMATFLQSLDENSDAYDGIVITEEIREQLADTNLDLTTASEEDVQQLVEGLGKEYVSEDAAMEHVEDMLVERTDLDHAAFEEHLDDAADTTQQRDSGLTATAAEGFEAAEATAAQGQTNVGMDTDITLSVPSLDLPGTDETVLTSEEIEVGQDLSGTETQTTAPSQENDLNATQDQASATSDEADLAQALPDSSLSSLFEEATTEATEATESQTDTGTDTQAISGSTEEQSGQENTDTQALQEDAPTTVTDETVIAAEDQAAASDATTAAGETPATEEHELSIDALHIAVDETAPSTGEAATESEESATGLESFTATSETLAEDGSATSLGEFSANNTATEDADAITSIDELDAVLETTAEETPEDAGLNDVDSIQEDLSEDPEQIDPNGVG